MKISLSFLGSVILVAAFSIVAFGQGLPGKYHTYAEGIAELQALVTAHPDICKLDSIGCSNRDNLIIYQFKISDNATIEEDEPAIFFDGGVHADEVLGPEIVLYFCNDIVSRYLAGDTAVQRYVNNYEIYAIPFINPEGHVVVENGDTDWRKNKSDNNNNGLFDFHDGVDNNRNYDYGFNLDTTIAGNTPESLEYKGPYAFSESENRAMRDIGTKYKPIIAVDYHSPTYGRSEKVYYNWYWYAYNGGHGMAPDEGSMGNIARGFAGSIINDRGDSSYEARRGLVDKGDFKTYYYAHFGTAAMVCEVSDTTIQDTSLIDPVCQRNLVGMYWLLRRAGNARLTGLVTDSITGLPLDAIVTVQQASGPDILPRHTRQNSGRYDRLIDPGTYTLIFEKTGYATKTISGIMVNSNGPTTTNVKLRASNPPPDAPILVSPADNGMYNDSTHIGFDWNDVPTATRYVIEIGADINFGNLFDVDSNLTSSNYRNGPDFYAGTFFWRVTAKNSNGYSPRSEIRRFTITSSQVPQAPLLITPDNDYTSNNAYLFFDWNDVQYASKFAIQIASDSLFISLVNSDTSLITSEYHNPDSLDNGIYYWKVKAGNIYGWSPYSEIRNFTIQVDTALSYIVGDVNHSGAVNGVDIVYFVNFLKGGPPPPFEINGFYPEADANGNCQVNGIDIIYLVNYFKGGNAPIDGHCFR